MLATGIATALVVGLIIAALGRLAVPGNHNVPIWLNMAIGVFAALVGTAIASPLGFSTTSGIDWFELAFQIVLAVAGVLIAARLYPRRNTQNLT